MSVTQYTKALEAWQTLPNAELFVWKVHAKKRAARIGGHVVTSACPFTGKFLVVTTAEIAKQYASAHARILEVTSRH